jgi:hypothetical protein
MEQGHRVSQLEARMKVVDGLMPSPEERAEVVWTLLRSHFPDLTDWDILCFATQYIAMQSAQWTWLLEPAKELSNLVHTAHYMMNEKHPTETGLKRAEPLAGGRDNGQAGSQENGARFIPPSSEHGRGGEDFASALHILNRSR